MKNIAVSLVLATSAFLSACGGGDGVVQMTTPTTPPTLPTVTVAEVKIPDVVFTNVKTLRSTAIQGQRSIEMAAFRVSSLPNIKPIGQLVFENKYDDHVYSLLDQSSVQLVDGMGDLNNRATNYSVRFDGRRMIVDFVYGWWAQDTAIPQTFSLKGNILPEVVVGKKFALALVGVQMHDYGASSTGTIEGGDVSVISVEGKGLPTISSSALNTYYALSPGQVEVVDLTVSCPQTNMYACVFMTLRIRSNGVLQNPGFAGYQDGTVAIVDQPFIVLSPGQNSTMYLYFQATTNEPLWVAVIDAEFDLGGTRVSPVVLEQKCGTIVFNRGCRG